MTYVLTKNQYTILKKVAYVEERPKHQDAKHDKFEIAIAIKLHLE